MCSVTCIQVRAGCHARRSIDLRRIETGYAIVTSSAPAALRRERLGDTGLRTTYGVTIAAFKHGGDPWRNADADTELNEGDTILLVGPTPSAEGFAQLR